MTWDKFEHGYRNERYIVGPAPNDEALAWLYFEQNHSGLLRKVFHIGPLMTLTEWLAFFLNPERPVVGCWRNGELVGLGWINGHEKMDGHYKGECGFTFSERVPVFQATSCARQMVRYIFDRYPFDSVWGTTPEPNLAAVAFAKRVGYQMYGPIPNYTTWCGMTVGAWFSCIARPSLQ